MAPLSLAPVRAREATTVRVSPPPAPDRGRRRRALWVVAITAGYFAILLLRRPANLIDPTIWAEDGGVFIAGSHDQWGHVLSVYAGQVWVLQRLVALAVGAFPAPLWPIMLYVVSCLSAAMAVAVVLSERARPLLGGFRFRVLAGTALVLLPAVWEVQGNLANLHWWAIIAAMVLLTMAAPTSRPGRLGELGVITVIAFTGLGGALLLPAALWRVLVDRSRYVMLRAAIVAMAAAVQVALTLSLSDRGSSTDLAAAPTFVEFLVKRLGGGLLVGERLMSRWWVEGSLLPLMILAVVVVGIVGALVLTDPAGPSWAWLGTGVLCMALAIIATPVEALASTLDPYLAGRYTLLALAAAVLIVVRALALGNRARRLGATAALLLMVGGVLGDAILPPLAQGIPPSSLVLMQACLDGAPEYADAPFCYVPTQPTTGDWKIVVSR